MLGPRDGMRCRALRWTRSLATIVACGIAGLSLAAPPPEFTTKQYGTFGDTCSGCHSPSAAAPPDLPLGSNIVPHGAGAAADESPDTNNRSSPIRSLMAAVAGNPMGSVLASPAGAGFNVLFDSDLEIIRLYLIDVRDGKLQTQAGSSTNFGNATVNQPGSIQTFVITNERGVAATFASPPSTTGDFSVVTGAGAGTCGTTVGASIASLATCTVRVQFLPLSAGPAANGFLRFTLNSPTATVSSQVQLGLQGNGLTPPFLSVDIPTSVGAPQDFVSPVGIDSAPVTFTVTNSGQTSTGITLSAAPAGFLRGGTCTNATTLGTTALTNSCTIILTFRPPAGAPTTTLGQQTVTPNLGNTVTIFARGTSPLLITGAVSPPFPVTLVGHPQSGTLAITSAGTAGATIGTTTLPGTAFTKTTACDNVFLGPALPGPAPFCNLPVTFTATSAGDNQTATLTIPYVGTAATAILTASARQLTATPPSGALQASIPNSSIQTVRIDNPSGVTTSIAAALVGAANFVITANTCGATLAGGGFCTIDVTFTPTSAVGVSTTLNVNYGPTALTRTQLLPVTISGATQLAPIVQVTPPALTFPDTLPNATSTLFFDVANIGNATLTVSSVTLTGNVPPDFNIVGNTCVSIVVGGPSCRITVTFTPSTAADRTAKVVITHNGTPTTTEVNLAGRTLFRPLISVSPPALDFGSVVINTDSTLLTSVVTNTGNIDLHLTTVSIIGADAADFTQVASVGPACASGGVVTPTTSCSITVRFRTAQQLPRSASVQIVHDAAGSPTTIALSGTGAPVPRADIQTNQNSLTFLPIVLRTTSAAQTVNVRNSGTADLVFSRIAATGAAAADYGIGGTCSLTVPLVPGATCAISVTFTPSATGVRDASLSIESNALRGVVTLPLQGTGLAVPAPVVVLAPSPLPFGDRTVNGLYPPEVITLTNTGNADLQISAIATSGTGFVGSTTCGATLLPGAACTISVSFTPVGVGVDYLGQVSVASNAAGSPDLVVLTGKGVATAVPILAWQLPLIPFAFGDVVTGTSSAVKSAVLTNSGPGGATLNLVNAIGPQASSFSVTGTCIAGTVLFQGQSCRVDVTFVPASAGAKQATIQIASSGTRPTPDVQLSGNGFGGPTPALQMSASTLAFATTRVGAQSLPLTVTLTSMGTAAANVTALAVSGPYAIQGSSCGSPPFLVASGNSCTVTLSFVPAGVGAATGKLTITSDADPTILEVALSGTAEAAPDVGGGGCSITEGRTLLDPTLWLLVLAALGVLVRRRAAPARRTRRDQP